MAQRAREICEQVAGYYYWGAKYFGRTAYDDAHKACKTLPQVCTP